MFHKCTITRACVVVNFLVSSWENQTHVIVDHLKPVGEVIKNADYKFTRAISNVKKVLRERSSLQLAGWRRERKINKSYFFYTGSRSFAQLLHPYPQREPPLKPAFFLCKWEWPRRQAREIFSRYLSRC